MFRRGGMAKGSTLTGEQKDKLLVGKQYATLQRALNSVAVGAKLTKAQEVAISNERNITDAHRNIFGKVKAKRVPKAKRITKAEKAVLASNPEAVQALQSIQTDEADKERLITQIIMAMPNLSYDVLHSMAFLSGVGGARVRRGRRVRGGFLSDLPIGQVGFDGRVVVAGAKKRRVRKTRGGAVSSLPIGQEGFDGRVIRAGAVSSLPIGQEGFDGRVIRAGAKKARKYSQPSRRFGGVSMGGVSMGGVPLGGVPLGGISMAGAKLPAKRGNRKPQLRKARGGSLLDTAVSMAPYIMPLLL